MGRFVFWGVCIRFADVNYPERHGNFSFVPLMSPHIFLIFHAQNLPKQGIDRVEGRTLRGRSYIKLNMKQIIASLLLWLSCFFLSNCEKNANLYPDLPEGRWGTATAKLNGTEWKATCKSYIDKENPGHWSLGRFLWLCIKRNQRPFWSNFFGKSCTWCKCTRHGTIYRREVSCATGWMILPGKTNDFFLFFSAWSPCYI